jgi:LPS-assembly protein
MRAAFLSAICLNVIIPGLAQATSCVPNQDNVGGIIAPQGDEPVYIEADTLIENREAGSYIARGNVVARRNARTVEADELEYRPGENRVIARGNVSIFSDNAPPQYADEIELDDALGEGLAVGFSTLLENNGRAAAAFAARRADGSLELTNAYYTACRIGGDGEEPTWRLRAARAVQDSEAEMIYYRDVRLEVLGVPVAYAPAFAHADPSSERRSGFLFPNFGVSNRLGLFYGQPYYWAISPYQDLSLSPRFMQNVKPLLEVAYRRRFWSGDMEFEASYTNERDIDSDGNRINDSEHRWHLFGGGEFDLNENWVWGFGVQLASDDFHLRTYDISETYDDYPGLFQQDPRRLMNQLYIRGRGDHYYAELATAGIQSLREFEIDDQLPVMAPIGEVRLTYPAGENFGRVRSVASTAVLTRNDGVDYQRASASVDWQAQFIAPAGLVFEPFAAGRADYYSFEDVPGALPTDPTTEESFGRFLGYAGAELSWPLINSFGETDTILEPMVQGLFATDASEAARIINEDSLTAELDETLLFDHNRATGYDLWEEGARLTYGLRSTTFWGENNRLRGFIGQSRRLDGNPAFPINSGLFDDDSDFIVAGEVDLGQFAVMARTRIDPDETIINRLDLVASYSASRFSTQLRYFGFAETLRPNATSEELGIGAQAQLLHNLTAIGSIAYDMSEGVVRSSQYGIEYRDNCTSIQILYTRINTFTGPLGPIESVTFRFNLFTIGGIISD